MRNVLFAAVIAVTSLTLAGGGQAQEPISRVASNDRAPRFLLATPKETVVLDVSRTPALRRRVSLDLQHTPLRVVVDAIAKQAGFSLSFSPDVVNLDAPVTLQAKNLTVAAALTEVLIDLRVDVVLSPSGQLSVVKQPIPPPIGTISGRVTDSASRAGIPDAIVSVEGTRLSARTNQDGNYTITAVPAGAQSITVRRLGYAARKRSVTVADNIVATLDIVLSRAATTLEEMVVTATGDRQRLEVGNAIGTIKADSVVATTLIRNMSDLLTARTPGVVVSNSAGVLGSPTWVRIRGQASLSLTNDPVIIVDGIRLQPASNTDAGITVGGGGTRGNSKGTTRLDDIDPTTIASIDVLRGPSASALYGTDAANGVIVIKTKQGSAGGYRLDVVGSTGTSHVPGKFPPQYVGFGHNIDGSPTALCGLYSGGLPQFNIYNPNVLDGTCIQDSVRAYDIYNDPRLSMTGTGTSHDVNASISGGSEALREFFSVHATDAVGVAKLSPAEENRVRQMWTAVPPWALRPNTENAVTGTSRTNTHMKKGLDVSLTASGIYRNTLGGAPGGALRPANATLPFGPGYARNLYDTLVYLPAEDQRTKLPIVIKRGYSSLNGVYAVLPWLTLRSTIGGDYTLRTNESLLRASDCTALLNAKGCPSSHSSDRSEIFVTTGDFGAQAAWAPKSWLSLRTSVGEQLSRSRYYTLSAGTSCSLAFGTELLSPLPVCSGSGQQVYSDAEARDESAVAGRYLEQSMALRDRLFVTGAFRQDAASAFGKNVNEARAPIYPKFSVSWLLSGEPFFPKTGIVTNARLRAAVGHSGQEARQRNVLNNYAVGTAIVDGATRPVIALTAPGNANLRPERTSEAEGGFDLSFLDNDRVQLEATIYRKLSHDAITRQTQPASLGAWGAGIDNGSATQYAQFVNLGKVENRGVELAVNARLLDRPMFAWDVTVNASRNHNKLVASTIAGVPTAFSRGNFTGYPLQSFFRRPIVAYGDMNGDGILEMSEVQFGSQLQWAGSINPESELTYTNSVRLLHGLARINAVVDQINGVSTSGAGQTSSVGLFTSRIAYTPGSLAQQAAWIQGQLNQDPYAYRANIVRFAELSITAQVPERMATKYLHARSGSVTFAGRNLGLWTNSPEKDPNMNDAVPSPDPGLTSRNGVPATRDFILRVNLGY